jgi:hypothetical protein
MTRNNYQCAVPHTIVQVPALSVSDIANQPMSTGSRKFVTQPQPFKPHLRERLATVPQLDLDSLADIAARTTGDLWFARPGCFLLYR